MSRFFYLNVNRNKSQIDNFQANRAYRGIVNKNRRSSIKRYIEDTKNFEHKKQQLKHWFNNGSYVLQTANNKNALKNIIKKNIEQFRITNWNGLKDFFAMLTKKEVTQIKSKIENQARDLMHLNKNHINNYKIMLDNTLKSVYTEERGWGVFALKPIKKFSVISFYHGILYQNDDKLKEAIDTYGEVNVTKYLFGTGSDKVSIGGYQHGNILALVNSADIETVDKTITNNTAVLEMENYLIIYVATRDIKEGEQLFVPYGDKFHTK